MGQAEGAAWRVQLDAMIRSLDTANEQAGEHGDETVLRMIANLYAAREAASEIEMRPVPGRKPAPVIPLRRGVSLVKRT